MSFTKIFKCLGTVMLFIIPALIVLAVIELDDGEETGPRSKVTQEQLDRLQSLADGTGDSMEDVKASLAKARKIIERHLSDGDFEMLVVDRHTYPALRDYVDSILISSADFSDFEYSRLNIYRDVCSDNPVLGELICNAMDEKRYEAFARIGSMGTIEEITMFYKSDFQNLTFLEDYLDETITCNVNSLPYPASRQLDSLFSGTPAGERIDIEFRHLRDSLVSDALAYIQSEFDNEIVVLEELRYTIKEKTAENLETALAKVMEICTYEAFDNLIGDLLDLFCEELDRIVKDSSSGKIIRTAASKATKSLNTVISWSYDKIDAGVEYVSNPTDSTFLSWFDNGMLYNTFYYKERGPFLPLSGMSEFKWGTPVVNSHNPVSGLKLPTPLENDAVILHYNKDSVALLDKSAVTEMLDAVADDPETLNSMVPFVTKIALSVERHARKFVDGKGLKSIAYEACGNNLNMKATRDSVLTWVQRYSDAALRNRLYVLNDIIPGDLTRSDMMMDPSEVGEIDFSLELPLKKIEHIQRLNFRETNYDVASIVAGMNAESIKRKSINTHIASTIYEVADIISGIYVNMKCLELSSQALEEFGQQLSEKTVSTYMDYIDEVFDRIVDITISSQNHIKEYINENY